MTKFDVITHDLAIALSDLPASTPNRLAIYIRTLESFATYAVSESHLKNIQSTRADIERVEQIQKDSKNY